MAKVAGPEPAMRIAARTCRARERHSPSVAPLPSGDHIINTAPTAWPATTARLPSRRQRGGFDASSSPGCITVSCTSLRPRRTERTPVGAALLIQGAPMRGSLFGMLVSARLLGVHPVGNRRRPALACYREDGSLACHYRCTDAADRKACRGAGVEMPVLAPFPASADSYIIKQIGRGTWEAAMVERIHDILARLPCRLAVNCKNAAVSPIFGS
jgi:hypothetical protein